MATYYLASSTVVKRYIRETGTNWILGVVDPAVGNDLFLLQLTGVEVTSAIVRRERGGTVPTNVARSALTQFRDDFTRQYQTVEASDAVVFRAMDLAEVHGLRAYDALQLAAALELDRIRAAIPVPPMTFVSSDQELNSAAAKEGLAVEDPNTHP